MATLAEVVRAGQLQPISVRLKRHEYPDRTFFAYPEFYQWLTTVVPKEKPFYSSSLKPSQQSLDILKTYISGKKVVGSRLFQVMSPRSDDVWEMRSLDLRFFGWVIAKDKYVAVCGDTFARLKEDPSLYETHRIRTVACRNELDLDEPKCLYGAKEHEIVSE